jgi:YVTN family beta-propeller protein
MRSVLGKVSTVFGIWCTLIGAIAHAAPQVEATLTLGNKVQDIAVDPVFARAYVINGGDATLSVIDLNALQVATTITTGLSPKQMIADAATHRVYVTNDDTPPILSVLDEQTNTLTPVAVLSKTPRGLGSNFLRGEVYVTMNKSLLIIDAATGSVLLTVPIGAAPGAPASNDVLQKIYVPNANDNTVSVIDETTHAVIATVPVGMGPLTAAIDGLHSKVYVNNSLDNSVSVIDSTTDTVVATIASGVAGTGTTANSIVVSTVYHRAYLPNAGDGTLTIINTDDDTVAGTVTVGTTPIDTMIDENGGNIYIANQDDNSLSILDAGTEAVIDTVKVGKKPWRVVGAPNQVLALTKNGTNPDAMVIASPEDTRAETAIASDFHEAAFDHYFHTADPVETRLLIDGLFADDWHRTFDAWRVWSAPGPGRVPVCRFFSTAFGDKSSHFYTPYAQECQDLQAPSSVWQLETTSAYYVMLTDDSGNCPSGSVPLYRVYNNGMGGAPNHRYTSDTGIRDQMVALGWIAEGNGSDIVFACIPGL